jgi:predicted ATPase
LTLARSLAYIPVPEKGNFERGRPLHLTRISFFAEDYPTRERYPFNQKIFLDTDAIDLTTPVTFFLGENGTGKSTLLEALAFKCSIHIWKETERVGFDVNPYQELLYRFIGLEWTNGVVPGSFFSSQWFRHFAQNVDEWAAADPETLRYFGGKSLVSQSHGESLMTYFKARYQIRGLYLLDEPETALSPRSQVEFVRLLRECAQKGHAQFIVASHSPIILACPGARIYDFNRSPLQEIRYEDTEHLRIYRDFLDHRESYFEGEAAA